MVLFGMEMILSIFALGVKQMLPKKAMGVKKELGSEIIARLGDRARQESTDILRELGVQLEEGLTPEEAERRLERFGPNRIVQEKRISWPKRLVRSYANPFNFILTFLAIISYLTDVHLPKLGSVTG